MKGATAQGADDQPDSSQRALIRTEPGGGNPINGKETTMTRAALLERLRELQQTPRFQNRDICTVSAMLSKEALARHLEVCEAAAAAPERGAEARSRAA